jgi:hypothetical protein
LLVRNDHAKRPFWNQRAIQQLIDANDAKAFEFKLRDNRR